MPRPYPVGMGIGDHLETVEGWHAAAQALIWQAELGAVDLCGDGPVDRYALADELSRPNVVQKGTATPAVLAPAGDAVAVAGAAAGAAESLYDLRAAMAAFDLCEMKRGAKSLVFADGNPCARVMIIGEAPGRDEDIEGRPFVGRAGQLLDRMLAAIGMARDHLDPGQAVYITNVMPWRPPQNRDPEPAEVAMMLPFLQRHVALANPDLIVVMGNTSLFAALGVKGITRLRGTWTTAYGKPALPMLHPAYLLRNPIAKREAWADLLTLQGRLAGRN
jgi:uracil-DNA glycosylase family 4